MPAGDRTGPMGFGPMTGRAAGYCAGYSVPGYANAFGGRGGVGRGRGGGWGWRNRYRATGVPGWAWFGAGAPVAAQVPFAAQAGVTGAADEAELLKNQAKYLEDALDGLRKRIEELDKQAAK